MYKIEEYVTEEGEKPFFKWFNSLKDKMAKKKILVRLARAELGNLGDWKPLQNAEELSEIREHYNPGYRIFFSIIENNKILLINGSTKDRQKKSIALAIKYLNDYKRRMML